MSALATELDYGPLSAEEAEAEQAIVALTGTDTIGQKFKLLQLCAMEKPRILCAWRTPPLTENVSHHCVMGSIWNLARVVYTVTGPHWMAPGLSERLEVKLGRTEILEYAGSSRPKWRVDLIIVPPGQELEISMVPPHPPSAGGVVTCLGWAWRAEEFREAIGQKPWRAT